MDDLPSGAILRMLPAMAQAPEKDTLDLAIDFFFGAVFTGGAAGFVYVRTGGWHFTMENLCVMVVTWAMMGGSLAAMYRDVFWSALETYTLIPPIRQRVSRRARAILWSVFGVALAMLILHIALSPGPMMDRRRRVELAPGEKVQLG